MFSDWLKNKRTFWCKNIKYEKTRKKFAKSLKMPRSKRTDGLSRVEQMRVFRKNRKERRRFETPLREFIETKYQDIFNEYVELYQRMNDKNPNKNDLTKTQTFKDWKKQQQQQQQEPDTLSRALRETIEIGASYDEECHTITNNDERQDHVVTVQRSDNEWQEQMLAIYQVDEMVNEMINDDMLREVLNTGGPQDDEGIGLNLEDEIDIEPFDFALEVELETFEG